MIGAFVLFADIFVTGSVDQLAAPALPFQKMSRLIHRLGAAITERSESRED